MGVQYRRCHLHAALLIVKLTFLPHFAGAALILSSLLHLLFLASGATSLLTLIHVYVTASFSGSGSGSGGEVKRALWVGRTCKALSDVVYR
jgi:hypothetical protein